MPGRKNVTISSPTEGFVPKISLPSRIPVNGIPGTAPVKFAPMSSPLQPIPPGNEAKRRVNVNNEHTRTGSV